MRIMNKKELPKCSVEITLSLISNKWKRFTRWNKKIWRVEKIYKRNF